MTDKRRVSNEQIKHDIEYTEGHETLRHEYALDLQDERKRVAELEIDIGCIGAEHDKTIDKYNTLRNAGREMAGLVAEMRADHDVLNWSEKCRQVDKIQKILELFTKDDTNEKGKV